MNEVSTIIVFIVVITFFILITLIIVERNELFIEYRKSKTNNIEYGIQEKFNKSDEAVELLAKLHQYMQKLVAGLAQKYPNDDRVKRLVTNFKNCKIEESPDKDDESSYTINKGELMAICLRHKKEEHHFHTLLFVIIHELSHIASITEGHNAEFIANFKWLLQEAKKMGYYEPVDYRTSPMTYCGVKVTNNPYF